MSILEAKGSLPEVMVASLNRDYGTKLTLESNLSDLPPETIASAGDLLSPLHLLLAEIACQDGPLHCAKMRFAAAAVNNETGKIVETGYNSRIRSTTTYRLPGPLFCVGEDCIRFKVPSRTDALIGECEHAFWVTTRAMQRKGLDLSLLAGPSPKISLYEAGFSLAKDGPSKWLPWVGKEPYYTCLHCDRELVIAGIEAVWAMKKLSDQDVPRWTKINVRESLVHDSKTALTGYATS